MNGYYISLEKVSNVSCSRKYFPATTIYRQCKSIQELLMNQEVYGSIKLKKRMGRQVGILTATEQHQDDLQRLCDLRPIDDDFMRCMFKDNIPPAEFVLHIITDKKD